MTGFVDHIDMIANQSIDHNEKLPVNLASLRVAVPFLREKNGREGTSVPSLPFFLGEGYAGYM